MRFSAWSLRVISVCSALVFVPSAWAHLSVSPTRVGVGEAVDLTFGAPNEDDDLGVDHVTLTVPAGVRPRRRRGEAGLDAVACGHLDHLERRPDPQGRVRHVRHPGHRAEDAGNRHVQRPRRRPDRQVDHVPGRARRGQEHHTRQRRPLARESGDRRRPAGGGAGPRRPVRRDLRVASPTSRRVTD